MSNQLFILNTSDQIAYDIQPLFECLHATDSNFEQLSHSLIFTSDLLIQSCDEVEFRRIRQLCYHLSCIREAFLEVHKKRRFR